MTLHPIPAIYIQSKASLSWREVQRGYEEEWLDELGVVEFAVEHLCGDLPAPSEVLELASLGRSESARVPRLLSEVVAVMDEEFDRDSSDRIWLYLLLSWVFDHRHLFADPLGVVEQLYAEFDYPQEMAGFVRYMPSETSDQSPLTSAEEECSVEKLQSKWRRYLNSFSDARLVTVDEKA